MSKSTTPRPFARTTASAHILVRPLLVAVLASLGTGLLAAHAATAQQAPTISESLLNASLADLLGSARGGSGPVQAYYVTRLARRLHDVVLESMDDAPSAQEFPGTSSIVELSDLVGPAGTETAALDPGVTQGVRELMAWYQPGSWNRGDRQICAAGEGDFAGRLIATNSWWSATDRIEAARSLTHALGLFYERSSLVEGPSRPAESVCLAEGTDVVALALEEYPGPEPGPVGPTDDDPPPVVITVPPPQTVVREAWWKRPQFVLPAVGAVIGAIILWASDDDGGGARSGTVIVRIPVP